MTKETQEGGTKLERGKNGKGKQKGEMKTTEEERETEEKRERKKKKEFFSFLSKVIRHRTGETVPTVLSPMVPELDAALDAVAATVCWL